MWRYVEIGFVLFPIDERHFLLSKLNVYINYYLYFISILLTYFDLDFGVVQYGHLLIVYVFD